MRASPAVGNRVRVMPSGEIGRVTRVVQAADGRPTYEVEFEPVPAGSQRGSPGESGGLYMLEDIEPAD